MVKTRGLLKNLRSDESGATAIEYGLLAALIAVAIIGTVSTLGETIAGSFEAIDECLTTPDSCE